MKLILLLALFLCQIRIEGTTADANAGFPLISPGKKIVIVGQGGFLKRAIEKCSGDKAKVTMVSEKRYTPRDGVFPIYVGDTELGRRLLAKDIEKLDVEGYIIVVETDKVILYARAPKTDTGDPRVWVQADFARRSLGVDHYFPGPLGEVFPVQGKVIVPIGKFVENPVFKHRHWSGYDGKGGPGWRVRASGGGGRFLFHHNLYKIIDPVKYHNKPEYFPVPRQDLLKKNPRYSHLQPGQRYVPPEDTKATYWQPCTSNPEVLQITVDTILDYFDKHPGKDGFSIGVNDSGGFCFCAECLKIHPAGVDPKSGTAVAYRFSKFYNEVAARVAKKYPDARLGYLFYGSINDWMPEKLHPCLMPYITQNMADCFDTSYRARNYKTIRDLASRGAHIGIYEYLYGMGFMIPRIYTSNLADGLRFFSKQNGQGFYAEAYPNWGLDGPKLWILEKLLWDPDQDEKELLKIWCKALFNRAAPEMAQYFRFLEQAWMEQKPSNTRRGMYRLMGPQYKKEQFTEVFTPEICENAWRLLEKAEAAAKDENVKKRIAFFKDSFGITRLASNRFNASVQLNMAFSRDKSIPLHRALELLENWAKFPSIQTYSDKLKKDHPYSLQAFSIEKYSKRKASFAQWDSEPDVILRIMAGVFGQAFALAPSERRPENARQLKDKAKRVLEDAAGKVNGGSSHVANSLALLERFAQSAIDAEPMFANCRIDGVIEEQWGEPNFEGRLFRYPYLSKQVEEKTQFWVRHSKDKLFFAFRCCQPTETIMNKKTGHDQITLNNERIINGGKSNPYLSNVDSVGVAISERVIAIVTSANGTLDAVATARGADVALINGIESAVAKEKDGWTAEFSVDLSAKNAQYLKQNPLKFNFFRVKNHTRSAWAPAAPSRWHTFPRTHGYLFLMEQRTP